MQMGCVHSGLFWPHYRQAGQEAARHLPPGEKAPWVASSRSTGAEWTEAFCFRVVFEAAEAQLRAIARYKPPGGTFLDEFLQHMLRLGDFAWELRNLRLEQQRGLRAPMAHCGGGRLSPPSNASQQGLRGLSPPGERHFGESRQAGSPSLPGTAWGFLEAAPRRALPTLDHRTQFHDRVGGTHCGCGVSARVEPVSCDNTHIGNPSNAVRRRLTWGWGTAHPTATHGDSWGGLLAPVGRGDHGMAAGGPEAPYGMEGRHILAPPTAPPPRLVLHTGNVLWAAQICTWGCDAATFWWFPSEEGGTRLTVAHLKKRGPTYDDALSQLGHLPGPLLLMLPTDLDATLHRELNGYNGLGLGWEAVADGALLALLHRGAADGCLLDALVPNLPGRHTYMTTTQGRPRADWDDRIAAFYDHGVLPDNTWQAVRQKTLNRDYWRRVGARLLELRGPLRQRWDDFWPRCLDPWSPALSPPHTCHLCRKCDTVSSATPTGTNRCTQCTQVAACPWPKPSGDPHRCTEEEAL